MKSIAIFSLLALLSLSPHAAAQLYFDTNGTAAGTAASASVDIHSSNWTTDSAGLITPTAYVDGSDVIFSAGTNGTGLQQVAVTGTASAGGITVNNGTVVFSGSATPNFSLGGDGITLNSTDGGLTFNSSLGTLNVGASQNWNVDSNQGLTVSSGLAGTGQTVTLAGTGTGTVLVNGAISGSLTLANNSTTSVLEIGGDNNSSFTGGLSANAGTITVDHHDTLNGTTINLSNGATLNLANVDGFAGYNENIVVGTGGANFSAGILGSYGSDLFFNGSITGHNAVNFDNGDLLYNGGDSDITTLTISGGSRIINLTGGLFANNASIHVTGNSILDFGTNINASNAITVDSGSAIETRGGGNELQNVTLPGAGTLTLGADDSGGGAIQIDSALTLAGTLDLYIRSAGAGSEAHLAGAIDGTGDLVINPTGGNNTRLYLQGNNGNFSGTTEVNLNSLYLFNGGGNALGNSTVTLGSNFSTLYVGGGYGNYVNANHFIMTNDSLTIDGGGGIASFSGYITGDATSVLHIQGSNNTFIGNVNANSVGTVDVDSGRLFLFGTNGANILGSAVVYVNNPTGAPYGPGFLDFATQQTDVVNNVINFASGTGLQMRGSGTNIELTNANLPTAGLFYAGSDDTSTTGSYTLDKGVALTGDLTFDIDQSNNSSVPVTLMGAITGSGGITQSFGTFNGFSGGVFNLKGTNTYSGSTTLTAGTMNILGNNTGAGTGYNVTAGTMDIGTGGSISSAAIVTLNAGTDAANFQLGDGSGAVNQTVASINATGTVANDHIVGGNGAVSTLTVNNAAANTYAGVIGGAGSNQNNIAVTKTGAGTLTLSGANTYTGGTTVSTGRLAVDGSLASSVQVALGAELGGHGTVNATISGAGAVGPGNSPGILTAQSVDPSAGTSFNFEFTLNGAPDYATASASGNDVLHLEAGTPFLAALSSSNVINLYFTGTGTFDGGFFVDGTTDTLTPALQNATFNYYVATAGGAVTYNGTAYALSGGSAAIIAANAGFADGPESGFTEQFTVGAVPEPSSYALLGVGGLALVWFARRKTRFNK